VNGDEDEDGAGGKDGGGGGGEDGAGNRTGETAVVYV